MLVYCNNITFTPEGGLDSVLQEIARWLGQRVSGWVEPESLKAPLSMNYSDGFHVLADMLHKATGECVGCISLLHPDETVSGRQWVTEIGIQAEPFAKEIKVTILLRTNEVSAKVSAPVTASRPQLAEDLAKSCNPKSGTPGMTVVSVAGTDVEPLRTMLYSLKRPAPLVIVSHDEDGTLFVDIEYLQSQLIGVAQVLLIEPPALMPLMVAFGQKLLPFGGAVMIHFVPQAPKQQTNPDALPFVPTVLVPASELKTMDKGKGEKHILTQITHRTNLPMSWGHISPDLVRQLRRQGEVDRVRGELTKTISETQAQLSVMAERLKRSDSQMSRAASDAMGDAKVLMEQAEAAMKEARELISGPDKVTDQLKQEVVDLQSELAQVKAETYKLEAQIESAEAERGLPNHRREELSALMIAAAKGRLTLEQALVFLEAIYPNHLVVLESARRSAKDAGSFKRVHDALDLMIRLVTVYRALLLDGKPDSEARMTLGSSYHAKESDLSKEGTRKRTFDYKGKEVFMEQHLAIGVKASKAETWRLHFHWDADGGRIVIGHCGEHLPLKSGPG